MNLGGNEYWGYAQSLDLFALINTERLFIAERVLETQKDYLRLLK